MSTKKLQMEAAKKRGIHKIRKVDDSDTSERFCNQYYRSF